MKQQPEYDILKTLKSGDRVIEIRKPKSPIKDYEVTLIHDSKMRKIKKVWLFSPEFLGEISKLTDEHFFSLLEDGF